MYNDTSYAAVSFNVINLFFAKPKCIFHSLPCYSFKITFILLEKNNLPPNVRNK